MPTSRKLAPVHKFRKLRKGMYFRNLIFPNQEVSLVPHPVAVGAPFSLGLAGWGFLFVLQVLWHHDRKSPPRQKMAGWGTQYYGVLTSF